jgi:hypothetical protein
VCFRSWYSRFARARRGHASAPSGRLSVRAVGLSSTVAVGRIESLTTIYVVPVGATRLERAVVAEMIVDTSWKQPVGSLKILTSFSDCDYRNFQLGRRYLVFADSEIGGFGRHSDLVWAPRCWPSRELDPLEKIPSQLGEPMFRRPRTNVPHGSRQGAVQRGYVGLRPRLVIAAVLTHVLAAGVALLSLWRR